MFLSAASAIVASMSRSNRIARFGLSFYSLFSSLVIYANGEAIPALVYLVTAGILLAAYVAHLETRWNVKASHDVSGAKLSFLAVLCMIAAFIITYIALRNFIYSISLSIVFVAAIAMASRNLMRTTIGLVTLESAVLLILTEIGWFTTITSIPICLLMLTTSAGLPYALSRRLLK